MAQATDAPRRAAWRDRLDGIAPGLGTLADPLIDAILDAEDEIRGERRWTDADVKAMLTRYYNRPDEEADGVIARWPLP
jgi:hypothetical protein